MHVAQEIIDKVLAAGKIEAVAEDFSTLKKSGTSLQSDCPFCKASGKKGLMIQPAKQIFKCFSCGEGGKGSLKYLMQAHKMSYLDAITYLANKYNIDLHPNQNNGSPKPKGKKGQQTFCDLQLHASGLSYDDIKALVYRNKDEEKEIETHPFKSGSVNDYFQLIPDYGDDMVIYYYNLEGHQITFIPPKRTKPEAFFRIRFQNPDARKDKFGKPIKYYSPAGSGTNLYVPQAIRNIYKASGTIETLYIQEGEKKAEKCCKHGLLSVGIMGIHNIGSNNTMPKDLQYLVQRCKVKKIVLMFDSDWQDISHNLKSGDNPQIRPLSFFSAVRNYKEYMLSFRNLNINLEIYFGAINQNEANEKGIDDLLAGTFKLKEKELIEDIVATINAKDPKGKYATIYKITALTDFQIRDFWKLNSPSEFAKKHKDLLDKIPEFSISRTKYRFNEDGEFELAEPLLPEEKFWQFTDKGKALFRYKRAYTFLQNRGYGRLHVGGKWRYVHFKDHVVKEVEREDIKYFVMETAEQVANEEVQDMLFQGGHFYLGPHSIENLKAVNIIFESPSKSSQNLHFKNCLVKIQTDKVETFGITQKTESIWADKIINFNFKFFEKNFIDVEEISQEQLDAQLLDEDTRYHFIEKANKGYLVKLGEEAIKCHFLQWLFNVSNFHHNKCPKILEETRNVDAVINTSLHVLSKLTTLGYLCHRFHNPANAKAIVAVDGKISEVGASHGRTGKSLFGMALAHVMPQVYIGGKARNLTEDQFLFEEINEKTENVFLDDIRTNFDFEFLFPNITGQWKINAKGVGRWTLPYAHPLKIFLSTNHMINGEGSSFTDRMHNIVFSDYYSDTRKPTDDFGALFFDEWDEAQWNLFYNLVVYSLQLYFQYGLISPPSRNIEKRRLRQMMGEEFLTWAEEYFAPANVDMDSTDPATTNLEVRIPRKELYEDFKNRLRGKMIDFYSPTRFGKCIRFFAQYKDYHFNPQLPNEQAQNCQDYLDAGGSTFIGKEDKSGGVEYFTISKVPIDYPISYRQPKSPY